MSQPSRRRSRRCRRNPERLLSVDHNAGNHSSITSFVDRPTTNGISVVSPGDDDCTRNFTEDNYMRPDSLDKCDDAPASPLPSDIASQPVTFSQLPVPMREKTNSSNELSPPTQPIAYREVLEGEHRLQHHLNGVVPRNPASNPACPIEESSSEDENDYAEFFVENIHEHIQSLNIFENNVAGSDVDTSVEEEQGTTESEQECDAESTIRNVVNTFDRQKASTIVSSIKKFVTRPILLAIISLYGRARYTAEQYDHLVAVKQDRNEDQPLPSSTTMRKKVFPRLLSNLFVKSQIVSFPAKAGYSSYLTKSSRLAHRQTEAVVVLPSSWAKMDVSCLDVLREIACISRCRCYRPLGSGDLRVDSSAHVLQRAAVSRHSDALWVNNGGVPIPSTVGMKIKFHTAARKEVSDMCLNWEEESYRGEKCCTFKGEIVSTIHIRYSSGSGVFVEEGLHPKEFDEGSDTIYNKCLSFIKTICNEKHENPGDNTSHTNAGVRERNDDVPQTRRQLNFRNADLSKRVDDEVPYLVPSDHLTVVRLTSSGLLGVYVSRFWVQRLDDERNFFIFLNEDAQGNLSHSSVSTFGAPAFTSRSNEEPYNAQSDEHNCRTTGRMADGMRFYMYRMILYADDFNPRSMLFPKGSVGGVYMSPSSFHVRSRRSQSCIRTISLTPAGVSTNVVLEHIIDDLVAGSLEGIECVDAFGERVIVFFDILGFIGDYPASSAVIDVKGHNATAPCTHCGFTFSTSTGLSTYAYTTSVHSCNSCHRRTQERTNSIRQVGLTAYHHKCLGMSELDTTDFINSSNCPLLKLASNHNDALRDCQRLQPFTAFPKDGYSLNLVAPDHLLTGLFKGVLQIVFLQLPSDEAREKLQIFLRSSLSEFGFQSQSALYKMKNKKLVPGLSMSALYCLLTVLPSTLEALGYLEELPSKRIVLNLHRFYSLSFWWPTLDSDGLEAWQFVHGKNMKVYHRFIQILAANFIKSVDKFNKSYPDLAALVDRPNIHRLLELVLHTIPLFNHVLFICELVFESAHQPLKFFLSRNHTLNSHVYSVHHVLAKDWMHRIWQLWKLYRDEHATEECRHISLIGLARLLTGSGVNDIDWRSPALREYRDDLRTHIEDLLVGTVEKTFEKWYKDSDTSFNATSCWVIQKLPKTYSFSSEQDAFFNDVRTHLSTLCLTKKDALHISHLALLNRGFGSNSKGTHEKLHLGSIVQVLLVKGFEEKKVLVSSISNTGSPYFFVIGALLKSDFDTQWAVVKKCSLKTPSTLDQIPDFNQPLQVEVETDSFYSTETRNAWYYLELVNSVREVGVIHKCGSGGGCEFSFPTRRVRHSTDTLTGGRFFLLTRSMAYPPRRS